MNGRLKKNIGFTLMPFAFVFLFEPGYAILDVLPDFIGYIFLCAAIINLSDICPKMQDAYNGFRKGILISVLRFVSIYLLKSIFIGDEQTVGVLLFTFVFSLAELVLLIPAYKSFFESIQFLAMMHDGSAVYQKRIKTVRIKDHQSGKVIKKQEYVGKNLTERVLSLTVFFLIVRSLAMTLPEFTTLIDNSSYEFIKILRLLSALIVLPVCILWLVRIISFCAAVRKDSHFIENLSDKYLAKAKATPELFTVRELTTGLYVMLTAFVLCIDIYVDKINILPNFIFFAVLLLGAIFLRKYSRLWKYITLSAAVGALSSVASYASTVYFHNNHQLSAIRKNIEAYNAFYRMFAFNIIEAVVLAATSVITVIFLWNIFKHHTNMSVTDYGREKKEATQKYVVFGCLSVFTSLIAGGSRIYFVAVQPYLNIDKWIFNYSSMISTALSTIFAVSFAFFVHYVIGEIKYRYRLSL